MKNISKKILAVLLAVTCAFSALAVNASASFFDDEDYLDDIFFDTIFEDGIYYTLNAIDEFIYATVSDFETDDEGKSVLPETVVIPESIEHKGETYTVAEIGYMAFADCSTLREITLPSTITSINDYAFSGASHLEKVVIPSDIEFSYFGKEVFFGTPVLGYFAENCEDGEVILGQNVLLAYLGNEKTYTVPEEIDFIADRCFFMSGVEKINFNETVTEILPYTFANCRNLKEIDIPDSIIALGEGAFSNCTNLEKVNLGDSFELFGYKVFEGTKVKEIYIGASVVDAMGAFTGCNTLEKITVSEDNEYYTYEDDALFYTQEYECEDGTYEYSNIIEYFLITSDKTTYTVPENVTVIGAYAFYNCKQLDEVIINSPLYISPQAFSYCDFEDFDFTNVTDIAYGAFRGCKNLTEIDLSNTGYIEDSAFENCTNLRNVTFSDSVYYVGARAFANTALTEVEISGDWCDIGEGAFEDCKNLKKVNFNDGVAYINGNVFASCPSLETVFVSKTVEYIDYYAFEDCQNVNFQIIKYSDGADIIVEYADDADNDVTKYEFVGKLTIFERIANFFSDIFDKIYDFFFNWL